MDGKDIAVVTDESDKMLIAEVRRLLSGEIGTSRTAEAEKVIHVDVV